MSDTEKKEPVSKEEDAIARGMEKIRAEVAKVHYSEEVFTACETLMRHLADEAAPPPATTSRSSTKAS